MFILYSIYGVSHVIKIMWFKKHNIHNNLAQPEIEKILVWFEELIENGEAPK